MNIKKIIGTSMIALLVVALSVSMAAAADTGTGQLTACDSVKNPKPIFQHGDSVFVYGIGLSAPIGGTDNNKADVYVVPYRAWAYNDTITTYSTKTIPDITLSDIAYNGTSSPLLLGTVGPADIAYGKYDVVYDHNKDGIYDSGDSINDWEACYAFNAVPEFATIAIPVLALLGLVLFMRRKKD